MIDSRVRQIELRMAEAADAAAIAHVQTATWKAAYAGLMPDEFLAALSADQRIPQWERGLSENRYDVVLALAGQSVIGFSAYLQSRDADARPAYSGEVSAIYVLPDSWHTGAGKALLMKSEEGLRAKGFSEVLLWVLDSNERARKFYERRGYTPDGAQKTELLRQTHEIREVRYRKELR